MSLRQRANSALPVACLTGTISHLKRTLGLPLDLAFKLTGMVAIC